MVTIEELFRDLYEDEYPGDEQALIRLGAEIEFWRNRAGQETDATAKAAKPC